MALTHIDCIGDLLAVLLRLLQISLQYNDFPVNWCFCEIADFVDAAKLGFSFQSDALSH